MNEFQFIIIYFASAIFFLGTGVGAKIHDMYTKRQSRKAIMDEISRELS